MLKDENRKKEEKITLTFPFPILFIFGFEKAENPIAQSVVKNKEIKGKKEKEKMECKDK